MTKQELVNAMRQKTKADFITKKELTEFLGYATFKSIKPMVKGLSELGNRLFIPEVAERLLGQMK